MGGWHGGGRGLFFCNGETFASTKNIKLGNERTYELPEICFFYSAFYSDVIFKPLTNNATRVAAALSGEVDIIDRIPVMDVQRIKKSSKLNFFMKPGLRLNQPVALPKVTSRWLTDNIGVSFE